ncbi:LysR family transcriptional regulator [Microbacterium thalassium]|uniref:DNA-binding transcriptional LysR family regulator n=1 Tax=Microbacterium thalassium TaxID=362649 RepID=A0A7X0FMH4_9MICO|nr:LysR family transcriptional regulator [Microbacterium thalassium]MBB6389711.1 DNA-binding transcriptional LysR family regulator [Microbacterium thalassium]GLK24762.1 transcriptional regulator [Microbacterium thalassium]
MDLNLVRVFVAVYETQSLTTAAARLFVTQPAVSQALGRLRRELDDPLFERDGRSMRPTPLADSVYPGFRDAIAGIDRTIDEVHTFDPSQSRRIVRIALSELGEIGWLPAILTALRSRAPHMRVEVVPLDVDALPEWLSRGTVDLAVTTATIAGGFERRVLKSQGYAVVMSEANPLAAEPVDLRAYASAQHVTASEDSGAPLLAIAQRRAGLAVDPVIALRHVTTLPAVLAASRDLIATVPDTIAEGWATTWPLVVQPLPFDMPPVEVSLYRRSTTQHMAALDWLYATVAYAIEGSSGRFFVIHGDAVERQARPAAGGRA